MTLQASSPAALYCAHMEDIKARVNRVNKMISGHSPMKNEAWDGEVMMMFLRKCLEQLAFSSLIANKDAYAAAHFDFATNWKLTKVLARIDKLNPDFYPRPLTFSHIDERGVKQMKLLTDGYLTREEMAFLYDATSEVIHTWNPYRPDPRVVNLERPLAEWVNRLQRLLDMHYVQLLDGGLWVVQMNANPDGRVHAFLSQPVEDTSKT